MDSKAARNSSIAAAILLSLLTLTVFASEQKIGPESSVRLFQEAALSRNMEDLQRVVLQPIGTPTVAELQADVMQLQTWGAAVQMTRTTRFQDFVVVDAQYRLSNGEYVFMAWVLRRDRGRWKVDSDQTHLLGRNPFGLY